MAVTVGFADSIDLPHPFVWTVWELASDWSWSWGSLFPWVQGARSL